MAKLLLSPALYDLIGHGKTWVHDRLNPESPRYDPTFPKPFKMEGSITNVWVESEVLSWIESVIEKGRANQQQNDAKSREIRERLQGAA
jgi:prophage regulatory protein